MSLEVGMAVLSVLLFLIAAGVWRIADVINETAKNR